MRVRLPFSLLLLGLLSAFGWATPAAAQTSGGPDEYGYTWISSEATGGPAFEWIDITADGTEKTGLSDDNFVGPIPIGFSFPYFWENYESLYIGTNGYVMFGKGQNVASGGTGFPKFPTSGSGGTPNNYVGVLLCDLTFTNADHNLVPGAKVLTKLVDGNKFVITWLDVPFWVTETESDDQHRGQNTFQLILHANGDMTFNWLSIANGQVSQAYAAEDYITRGFENITGRHGLGFPSPAYPANSSCIHVTYPASSTLEFADVQCEWVLNEDNGGVFFPKNAQGFDTRASIKNSGTVPVVITDNNPVKVIRQVFAYSEANQPIPALRDTILVTDLAPGESVEVSFPNKRIIPDNLAITGQIINYPLDLRVSVSAVYTDEFVDNNTRDAEITVVDTGGSLNRIIRLGYDEMFSLDSELFPEGEERIVGGGLEVGTYFEPPFYPARLRNVEFAIAFFNKYILDYNIDISKGTDVFDTSVDTLAGFRTQVFASDGPDGSPGTLLMDTVITPEFYGDNSYYDSFFYTEPNDPENPEEYEDVRVVPVAVTLPGSVEILEGGVYVSYALPDNQPDTIIARRLDYLVQDNLPGMPYSYRTFEITGGIWAPYRERNLTEFGIRVGVSKTTGSSRGDGLDNVLALGQSFPNPAAESASVPFELVSAAAVRLDVRNMAGQLVMTHDMGRQLPGRHTVELNTSTLAPGLYTYTLSANGQTTTRKMTVFNR